MIRKQPICIRVFYILYYDSNGNLIQDLNKKISEIQYNCLNLPSRIEFEDGGVISYLYDAKGTKFRTTHIIAGKTTTTDYFDDAIYENGVLTTLLTELGYISLVDGKYHYYLKDHQGNNRVVVGQNGSVEEVNHYYPFGGTFASTSSVQPYKYNGKELDRQGGLDWYDYGARHYDAALGRWHVVDPMAEKYFGWSPYNYCANNSINCIDPDGKKIIFVNGYLGFGSPKGGATYWGGSNSSFVRGAQSFFNDKNLYFTNYEFEYLRSSTFLRNINGYNYAKENYEQLIAGMDPRKDNFCMISHSMRGAFSQGMIKYLKEKGWNVDFAIYLNAWLPSELTDTEGVFSIDATVTNDWVQGWSLPINGNRDIPNANYRVSKQSEKGWKYRHKDLIDSNEVWKMDKGLTWKEITPLIESWLEQNPNIEIKYGQ